MAVSLNPRAERLLARLSKLNVYSLLELLLLVLIAVQCARLFWGVLTPVGPVGDYKALDRMRPAPPPGSTLGNFDPFFRQAPGAQGQAPVTVTSLDIRLYGIMANRATGGGSAIIGTANGEQRSYQVGEEIMPGVTLTGIAFDHVTISRGGANEQLFLDQTPVSGGNAPVTLPGSQPPVTPQQPQAVPVPTVRVPPPPPPAPPPVVPRPQTPTVQTLKVNP